MYILSPIFKRFLVILGLVLAFLVGFLSSQFLIRKKRIKSETALIPQMDGQNKGENLKQTPVPQKSSSHLQQTKPHQGTFEPLSDEQARADSAVEDNQIEKTWNNIRKIRIKLNKATQERLERCNKAEEGVAALTKRLLKLFLDSNYLDAVVRDVALSEPTDTPPMHSITVLLRDPMSQLRTDAYNGVNLAYKYEDKSAKPQSDSSSARSNKPLHSEIETIFKELNNELNNLKVLMIHKSPQKRSADN